MRGLPTLLVPIAPLQPPWALVLGGSLIPTAETSWVAGHVSSIQVFALTRRSENTKSSEDMSKYSFKSLGQHATKMAHT